MKKSILLFAVVTAAVVCSCTHEEVQIPATVEYREIVLSAHSGDAMTKSSRDHEGTFYWSPNDAISLFRGRDFQQGGWALTSTNTESAVSAYFKGELDVEVLENPDGGKYWAIYPYDEFNGYNGEGVLTTVVRPEQTAAEGTFADKQFVSIGCSDGLSMDFYHLCGGIKFTLEQSDVKSITLHGNDNEPIAGIVEVVLDDYNHPVVYKIIEGYNKITLTCPDGGCFMPGVEYFIVTLPVKFEQGFTISFDNGFERVIDTPLKINRAKFQWSKLPIDFAGEFIYETCNIENEGVQSYMSEVDYSDDIYYYESRVEMYYRSFGATDKPLPVTFTWEGEASSIVISNSKSFDEILMTLDVSNSRSSSVDVYNLIPGQKYYYKVLNEAGAALKLACMTPEGPVRMINGVTKNMRDLGGWNTGLYAGDDGSLHNTFIKYGKIYRGYNINNITEEGARILLEDLGVTLELDLRGYELQFTNNPANSDDQPRNVLNGLIRYENLQPTMFMYDQRRSQIGVTDEIYREALKIIINELSNGGVVFFHCIGGADRTGTLAFLIEALMGVSESDMSKDFEMTTFYNGSPRRRNMENPNGGTANFTYPYKDLIRYLKDSFGQGFPYDEMIQDIVENWATSGENALTHVEIETLRSLLQDDVLIQDQ